MLETNAPSLPEAADAGGAQLDWLEGVLGRAAAAGVTVLVAGHIAPGASHIDYDSMAATGWAGGGWTARAQERLDAIARRAAARPARGAAATLAALFFGHLHGEARIVSWRQSWGRTAPLVS